MLKALKKRPKRPRGRPPGSKNLPKTLEGLIEQAAIPKRKAKADTVQKRRGTSGQKKNPDPYFAKLKREDPEKLKELQAKSKRSRDAPKKVGIPQGFTDYEWAVHQDEARKLAHRIIKQMDTEGALPENPIAREAMKKTIEMLAADISVKDKLAAIRTLLEYNLAKPASASTVTVKTAEDFLDEIAAQDE